jgi:signal transduction histidine kinase
LKLLCERMPANRLCASVQDDGKGMDAETVSRLADPSLPAVQRKVGLGYRC